MDIIPLQAESLFKLKNIRAIFFVSNNSLSSQLLLQHICRSFDVICRHTPLTDLPSNLKSTDLVLFNYADFHGSQLEELLNTILENSPCSSVIIVNTDRNHPDYKIIEWPNIKGVFHSDNTNESLLKGIKAVDNGELWLPRKYAEYLAQMRTPPHRSCESGVSLTPREKQIIELLVKGLSNQDMANELFVSPHTIKTHIYKLYKKIGVKNRVQALQWEQGLNNHLHH